MLIRPCRGITSSAALGKSQTLLHLVHKAPALSEPKVRHGRTDGPALQPALYRSRRWRAQSIQ